MHEGTSSRSCAGDQLATGRPRGAPNLLKDVFGEAGKHAGTALAMAQLPLGASVQVEMILQVKEVTGGR